MVNLVKFVCLCLVAALVMGCSKTLNDGNRPQVYHPMAVSDTVKRAATRYLELRQPVEDPVKDSLEFLLNAEFNQERIVVISYLVGPDNSAGWRGNRVVVLLRVNWNGDAVGGGAIGNVAVMDGEDSIPVAWTSLGENLGYAFYGPIPIPGVTTIELTERDGTTTSLNVNGKRAFYVMRPFTNAPETGWPAQTPIKLRALNSDGKVVYEKYWPAIQKTN